MRLQLTLATAAAGIALLFGCASDSSSRTEGTTRIYHGRTASIVSPRADLEFQAGESVRVDGHWRADVISAASPVIAAPDARSRASEYNETRHEVGTGVEWKPRAETTVEGTYTSSFEPDHTSHAISASWSRELLDRQATLSYGVRMNRNIVRAVDEPTFRRRLWIWGLDAGWTHILTPSSLVRLQYSVAQRNGYQANPYRYVPVGTAATGAAQFRLREHVPSQRTRHGAELLGVHSLSKHLVARAAYRLYLDDWSVRSHTLRGALWWEHPSDGFRLRVSSRAYTQTGAYFFRSQYDESSSFRTGDYRLSPMSDLDSGIRADFRISPVPFGRRLTVTTSYDFVFYWLDEYPPFDTMTAHVASVGLTWNFP